ncbi:MAG TPA: hypothetical protein DDX86_05205, partial [Akkermansia sp.]|nr:hypothetical protein [Akkermansia sp.]
MLLQIFPGPVFSGKDGRAENPLFAPERRFPLLPQFRVLQVEQNLSDGLKRNPDLADGGGTPFHEPAPDSFQGQGEDALI